MEALVCLALAVMLFRTFEVEGYMISTGSMAPSLLGFHKRAVCPACGSLFAYGIPYELPSHAHLAEDDDTLRNGRATLARAGSSDHANEPRQLVCCPNCGLDAIDLADVPRNQGDQLLVNKSAYDFRSPDRWDVIVFRNPYRPSQAYVKRAIGLPGERVQIIDGDIYINGEICR
ncbi:MAG: signal peptidase I, partial [Planctomycetaceae bacterium]